MGGDFVIWTAGLVTGFGVSLLYLNRKEWKEFDASAAILTEAHDVISRQTKMITELEAALDEAQQHLNVEKKALLKLVPKE